MFNVQPTANVIWRWDKALSLNGQIAAADQTPWRLIIHGSDKVEVTIASYCT